MVVGREFVGGREPAFCFGAAGAIDPEGGVGGWWGGGGGGEGGEDVGVGGGMVVLEAAEEGEGVWEVRGEVGG